MQQSEEQSKPLFNKKALIIQEEWQERLKNIQVAKDDMNKLIMNFFMVEGYKDAALCFQKETGTEISNQELDSMQGRIEVKKHILSGEIDSAIKKINNIDQQLLENDRKMTFTLKLQKMIELIKKNEIEKTIIFAQEELIPLVELEVNPALMDQVEKAMTLLAFEDSKLCPANELMQNSQRIKVSSEINNRLLRQQHNAQDAKISILMKLLAWSQQILKQQVDFPELFDVAKGQFKTSNENHKNIEQS